LCVFQEVILFGFRDYYYVAAMSDHQQEGKSPFEGSAASSALYDVDEEGGGSAEARRRRKVGPVEKAELNPSKKARTDIFASPPNDAEPVLVLDHATLDSIQNDHPKLEQYLNQLEREIKSAKDHLDADKLERFLKLRILTKTSLEGLEKIPRPVDTSLLDEETKSDAYDKELFALDKMTLKAIRKDRGKLELFIEQLAKAIKNASDHGNQVQLVNFAFLKGAAHRDLEELDEEAVISEKSSLRIAAVDFKIDNKMMHGFDFGFFKDRVLSLFEWYTDNKVKMKYMAPYFPLVQSSGMGKTKLLWELRHVIGSGKSDGTNFKDCVCATILCTRGGLPKEKIGEDQVFSFSLDVPFTDTRDDSGFICKMLDEIVTDLLSKQDTERQPGKVILLFDESQHLLDSDGFAFRAVRWWLRCRRAPQVVAVFTGTTSRLTYFYKETQQQVLKTSKQGTNHHESGNLLYDPFFHLCTVGLFANRSSENAKSEYERAVPYGRPLFAEMLQNNQPLDTNAKDGVLSRIQDNPLLDAKAEYAVLSRMLLNQEVTWNNDVEICLSILGTRFQMGQTSAKVAAELVAKGYAVLSHYVAPQTSQEEAGLEGVGRACIFFPTDPVCARLAMALMDEDGKVTYDAPHKWVQGEGKQFWTKKMSEIFSTGLCRPSQGDLGELAAAAYMLFCGDILRKKIDKDYRTFSVPLATFIECLLKPNDFNSPEEKPESKEKSVPKGCRYTDAHVNFIQVTRNYMRFSIEDCFHQDFLRDLYRSGSSFYAYPLCPVFDFVASIRLSNADEETFVPLFVSTSTEMEIGTQEEWLETIQRALEGRRGPIEMEVESARKSIAIDREAKRSSAKGPQKASTQARLKRGGTAFQERNANAKSPPKADVQSGAAVSTGTGGAKILKQTAAMGLRLLFDRSPTGYNGSAKLISTDDVGRLLKGEIVSKVLIVPKDDPFGIIDMLVDSTLCGSEESELYSSHSFVFNHGLKAVTSNALVRKTNAKRAADYLTDMRVEMLKSRRKKL
jgi:hypothetical protein